MTASMTKNKGMKPRRAGNASCVEVSLSPVEAGYIRLLSAVLQESEEEVVTELLTGRIRPLAR